MTYCLLNSLEQEFDFFSKSVKTNLKWIQITKTSKNFLMLLQDSCVAKLANKPNIIYVLNYDILREIYLYIPDGFLDYMSVKT